VRIAASRRFDGSDGMAQIPAVVDVIVQFVQGDGGWWLTCPGEEDLQVIEVVDRGNGMGTSAA
jgi:hypothetical protein